MPISLGEAQFENPPEESEAFTVQIGGKDYPLIPDYSLINHTGEEIDFGNDIWWKVEEYPGNYVCTDEDWEELQDEFFVPVAPEGHESRPELTISEDGEAVFNYSGQIFKGKLPEKRYYKSYVNIFMVSETQQRSFQIALREGEYHSSPQKIEFYSEGEPATNEPSKVPPILVYLTRVSE